MRLYKFEYARPGATRPGAKSSAVKVNRIGFAAVIVASLLLASTARAQHDQVASANDTARFLAGMQPSNNSPLLKLAQDGNAKQHATYFDTAFGNVEKNQLAKIREWSSVNLKSPQPVLFYMFGGPDFLYANAFFPNATNYVLSGLEPVGQIPDLMKLPPGTAFQAQRSIQASLRTVLTTSYFITAQMSQDLNSGPVSGTMPILYVFLARSGKELRNVSLVYLDERGVLHSGDGTRLQSPARGVKIDFTASDGQAKTLYYFSTNLADQRGKDIALLLFCKSLGQGDSFVKSASYLLHNPNFSQVRNFMLDNSASILQDDTGAPLANFDTAQWQLRLFGRYMMPIFPTYYQPKLNELYQKNQPVPIDFGVGYRWRANESNLILATRSLAAPESTASISKDVTPRSVEIETTAVARNPVVQTPPSLPRVANDPTRRPDGPPFFPPIFNGLPPAVVSGPGADPNGPMRQLQQCWVSTDRDRGFGYFRPC